MYGTTIERNKLKLEHTSRGSKLMSHLLHLYVHQHNEVLHCKFKFTTLV